jgi:uncharacterized protein (AIM24 family)
VVKIKLNKITRIRPKNKIMTAHEIDYQIFGEMQYVEIELDPQEIVIADPGSFMMMDNKIQMETIFGDGSEQKSGIFGQLLNAGKGYLQAKVYS